MKHLTLFGILFLSVCLAGALITMTPASAQAPDDDAFEQQRTEMLQRQRRVIFNNDGGDAVVVAKEPTPQGMLEPRTIGLEDTHVDTIFYSTNRGTFARHSHNSEVSETFMTTEGRYSPNVTPALIEMGTDPLQVMVEWCRENDKEIFWSERMNDRHDAGSGMLSQWKLDHPECLVGTPDERPPHGAWTQVDYAEQAVRDKMFSIIEEVCRNYDVDGIEMDFFRHLCLFRTTAWGEHATDEEVEIMTNFIRRVRAMTEEVGRERGKPILVAMRVTDSVPLALAAGIDLETWMSEGLVDIVTGSGYFRMNPWNYLAELGDRHGVLTYAGLSESRVRVDGSVVNRRGDEAYRARAAEAWQAGMDGIYLFNMFNPNKQFLHEIGDPDVLAGLDKTYFATVRGQASGGYGNPDYWVADGSQWRNLPILTPIDPLSLQTGESASIPVYIGDDPTAARERGLDPHVTCHVMSAGAADLSVSLNGETLSNPDEDTPWLHFPLADGLLRPGENIFEFAAHARPGDEEAGTIEWTVEDGMPRTPWQQDRMREDIVFAELQDDGLLIADRGEEQGDYIYFRYPWEAHPDRLAVAEAEVKVIDGWSNFTISNGVSTERLALRPDHISTHFTGLRYDMDTTDDFHTYRVEVQGEDIRIYVDGELVIDGEGAYTQDANGRNSAVFGGSNSPSLGEALWRRVSLTSPGTRGLQVYDLAVTVDFPDGE
ncbi:MAG: hypothetical protein ACLFU7_00095 [Armatimonadota bacterium]